MRRIAEKLGNCVLCGKKVYTDHLHIKAVEGYCHQRCIFGDSTATA